MQELAQFLEASSPLVDCPEWRALQPPSGGVLDGVARLPRQLMGEFCRVMPYNPARL